jgi:methyl-accepting chemotaxis protein
MPPACRTADPGAVEANDAASRPRVTTPPSRTILERHAEFHQVAGYVARQINAGAVDQAERLIGSGSRFAQVSTEVCTLLTRAKRGL